MPNHSVKNSIHLALRVFDDVICHCPNNQCTIKKARQYFPSLSVRHQAVLLATAWIFRASRSPSQGAACISCLRIGSGERKRTQTQSQYGQKEHKFSFHRFLTSFGIEIVTGFTEFNELRSQASSSINSFKSSDPNSTFRN